MGPNIEPAKAASATAKVIPNPKARPLARVRVVSRVKHSIRTEQAHAGWIIGFIFFHEKRHPSETSASSPRSITFLEEKPAHN